MKAAWYERQGEPRDVFVVGEMDDPEPGPGEVRIRVHASGINPGDLKKRANAFGYGMVYPRVVPHSDGAGVIDRVGEGVAKERIGERVWCFGAQSYRAFGTAAQYTMVPATNAVEFPSNVGFDEGACLGIPRITAHRAVHAGGPVRGKTVLVQGGSGGVGSFATGLARQAGARVVATVRSPRDADAARRAGAHAVVCTDGRAADAIVAEVVRVAAEGVHHVVEVAFDANIDVDTQVLAQGASIATYATGDPRPTIPFWDLLFKNARILLLGSDDFPFDQKLAAVADINELMRGGWKGFVIDQRFALEEIVAAHDYAQRRRGPGRVVLAVN